MRVENLEKDIASKADCRCSLEKYITREDLENAFEDPGIQIQKPSNGKFACGDNCESIILKAVEKKTHKISTLEDKYSDICKKLTERIATLNETMVTRFATTNQNLINMNDTLNITNNNLSSLSNTVNGVNSSLAEVNKTLQTVNETLTEKVNGTENTLSSVQGYVSGLEIKTTSVMKEIIPKGM